MPPNLFYRVQLRPIARQEVQRYPWLTGKPCLNAPGLVNAVVIKDYVDLARWILGDDVLQELDELSGSLSVEDKVHECARPDVHCAEHGLLLVRAGRWNPKLFAARHPRRPEGWEQM